MIRLACFTLCVSLILPVLTSAQEEKKAHPQETLETAIPHAIQLLEKKNFKELLDGYIPPDELKKMREAGAYETVVKSFGEGPKAERLLNALKEIQTLEPAFNEDKTVATYTSDKEDSPLKSKPLKFVKLEKRWYIK